MKRNVFAIIVCATLAMATDVALAGNPQDQSAPTRAEIQQKAIQDGPATSQIGYLSHKDPATAHPAGAVNPRLMRPLTQREVGMLLHACTAYAECKTAYAQAYDRYQAQLRASKVAGEQKK